jgi:hypothetical protein
VNPLLKLDRRDTTMSIYRLKGTSGELLNQAFALGDGLTIGGGDSDVPVGATGKLAQITVQGQQVVIRALAGDAQLEVNGTAVSEQQLAGGDEIRIGGCRFILQAPGLKPERVLAGDAVRPKRPLWPWWLAAAAVAGGTAAAWQLGWLDTLLAAL